MQLGGEGGGGVSRPDLAPLRRIAPQKAAAAGRPLTPPGVAAAIVIIPTAAEERREWVKEGREGERNGGTDWSCRVRVVYTDEVTRSLIMYNHTFLFLETIYQLYTIIFIKTLTYLSL